MNQKPGVYAAPLRHEARPNVPGANAAGTAAALRVRCASRFKSGEPCNRRDCHDCGPAQVIDEMAQELASLRDKLYGQRAFRNP